MSSRLWEKAVHRAGALAAPLALDELPDADLLRRYVGGADGEAFAALVRRHGPLVWAVCRHLLPTEADAEDAFQATFLALVKGAARVRTPNALGAWLHTVAGRVCRNGRRARARRRRREQAAAVGEADRSVDGAAWDRWQAVAHEEIGRLPDALRVPFVLCVLQGVRQADAARRLGWKEGSVSARVCKAKQALTDALTRRGLAGPAVLAGVAAATAPLTAGLAGLGAAVARPGAGVSSTIHGLARGATGGLMSKTKLLAAAVVAGTLAVGVGTRVLSTADAQAPGPPAAGFGPGTGPVPAPPGPTPPATAEPPKPMATPSGFGGTPVAAPGMPPTLSAPRVEYLFEPAPKGGPEAFKKLLTDRGNQGWEYVDEVPGATDLIFKRVVRAGAAAGAAVGTMPGMPGMMGPPGMAPGMAPAPPDRTGTVRGAGGPMPGVAPMVEAVPRGAPAGGGAADLDTITLQTGETIRHRMRTRETVERILNHDPKAVEVVPDPTDATRVLIRGLAAGSARVELTDAGGVKERHQIRVR